ncbi:MAG: hypothetical protein LLG97_07410 [Deltaproteobacteria bacterium]|nr:hypothetical protein [Deltaproteobacteria bacterium]
MKEQLIALMILFGASAAQAADVGVSVSIGQPGFYGRIDIGDVPRPEIIYRDPIVIAPPHRRMGGEPIYLRVPPGHEKKWSKHCAKYNACGRPVYFVKDRWYNDVYVPRHRAGGHHGEGHDRDRGDDRGHGHGRN